MRTPQRQTEKLSKLLNDEKNMNGNYARTLARDLETKYRIPL